MDWLGGTAQGIGTLTSGILNYLSSLKQIDIAQQSLDEQKAMNEREKKRYDATLANQKKGIATLGKAFEGLSESKDNTDSAQNTPIKNPSVAPNPTQQTTQTNAQDSIHAQKSKESVFLPTQRA